MALYRIPQIQHVSDISPEKQREIDFQRFKARERGADPAAEIPQNELMTEAEAAMYVAAKVGCHWGGAETAIKRAEWDGKLHKQWRGEGSDYGAVYARRQINQWLGVSSTPETDCYRWLMVRMDGPPDGKKDVVADEAKQLFGISRNGFDRVWGNARAKSPNTRWGKPGKPRKT